jgi:2-dehydro-3-deoxyphosphooctonate aldolase (KDO 8-P synthase)
VRIADVELGRGRALALVAGPCVIEDADVTVELAREIAASASERGVPLVFKASFDKANRQSPGSFRGPGIDRGLEILARAKAEAGVAVLSDVHEPGQAERAAEVLDCIQIPAFLCRQTDLITAAAATGKPVNIKKGQFMAPEDMRGAVEKARAAGGEGVILTERGTTFGYHNLVVDFRSIPVLKGLGVPVVFDATHSVQRPGGRGDSSGGDRDMIATLAKAAVAAGADGVFLEVHPDPERARCDAATSLPLADLGATLDALVRVRRAVE